MVYRSDNLQEILDHVREQFNFKVDLVPLFGIAGIDPMTPRPTSWYGCFRDDTNEPLGASVSGSYTPHQTDDVIALVDAAIGAFGRGVTEVKTDFADGHNVLVSPSAEWQKTVAGKDVVYPRLLVSAGYGGTSRLRCSLGLYRCLCENLEMFETISALNFSHKHTSGLLAKIDTIRKSFSGLARSWDSLEGRLSIGQRPGPLASPLPSIVFMASLPKMRVKRFSATTTNERKQSSIACTTSVVEAGTV